MRLQKNVWTFWIRYKKKDQANLFSCSRFRPIEKRITSVKLCAAIKEQRYALAFAFFDVISCVLSLVARVSSLLQVIKLLRKLV